MEQLTANPIAKFESTGMMVLVTNNYDIFSFLQGNRNVKNVHAKRLEIAFKNNYLFSPLIVNERLEIIDGQHRFTAAKNMNLPIYYIIKEGYGLKEVKILNSNSQNWNKKDYLDAWCDVGEESYLLMKKFMGEYSEFGIQASQVILTNLTSAGKHHIGKEIKIGKTKFSLKGFEDGLFRIPDIEEAYKNAERIRNIQPYYKGYNRVIFVSTMIGLFKNDRFDYDTFMKKIALQPTALKDCPSITAYKEIIENIYNYRTSKKVSFKYS